VQLLSIDNIIDSIHKFVAEDSWEMLEFILRNAKLKVDLFESDLNTERDPKSSNNVIHICAENNSVECFQLLVRTYTAEKIFPCLLRKNDNDLIPLNEAIRCNNLEIIEKFLQFCGDNKLNPKRMLEMANDNSNRSIHEAAEQGNPKIFERLLDEVVDLDHKNCDNKTCIEILSKKGHLKCLRKIFDNCDEFLLKSIRFENSVRLAIEHHHHRVVEYLLRKDDEISDINVMTMKYRFEGDNFKPEIDHKDHRNDKEEQTPVIIKYNFLNILDLAIKSGDEETAKIIVENADIDELEILLINVNKVEHEHVITFWELLEKMPRVAEMCLDKYLDLSGEKLSYDLDFIIMDRNYLLKKHPELKRRLAHKTSLAIMAENDHEHLLSHPFAKIYMKFKWNPFVLMIYYGGLAMYLAYVVLLSVLLIVYRDQGAEQSVFLKLVVLALGGILMVKELFQLASLRHKYFCFENIIEIVSFSSGILMTVPVGEIHSDFKLQSGCIAVIFSYVSLGFYMKRIPRVGKYAAVVMQVSETSVKFILSMSVFLVGVSIALYVLCSGADLDYKWSWILRSAFMLAGDFSFNDFANGIEYEIKYFVMAVCVVILPIVLNNILMSFSISDTNEVLGSAELYNLKTEVEFLGLSDVLFVVASKSVAITKDESVVSKLKHLFVDSVESIIKGSDKRLTALYKWQVEKKMKYKDSDDDDATNKEILARISELEQHFKGGERDDKVGAKNASGPNTEVLAKISSLEQNFKTFQYEVLAALKNLKNF